ncbi:hypothetical protein E1165_01020 [Micromonospora sp. KC723]|nr:hypothetical protein E1165_01020 [Micromonospora sp. KC723]
MTKFCRLDELGLEVVGQRLESDRAVLACRVVDPGRAAEDLACARHLSHLLSGSARDGQTCSLASWTAPPSMLVAMHSSPRRRAGRRPRCWRGGP